MNRIRSPKEIAFLILLAQTATGVLVAIIFFYFESIESARSSFIGSAIAILTSLHLLSVLIDKREKKPKLLVRESTQDDMDMIRDEQTSLRSKFTGGYREITRRFRKTI